MQKINIIQFMPYFPPHKGGIEIVGEEIGKYWVKKNFGKFINVVTDFEQDNLLTINEKIIFKGKIIGYKKDGYEVLICPSLEIISNFPIFKFWNKKYGIIMQYLKEKIGENKNDFRVLTHTRFFLISFIGSSFSKSNKLKLIHLEHGSDYVKLSSKLKTYLSIGYDMTLGKSILKGANKVLSISNASRQFILNEFIKRDVSVFYRGLDLSDINIKKTGDIKFIFVGRLVNLKGVSDLVEAYKNSGLKNELIIIGDGEEKNNLELKSNGFNISFLGYKDREFILKYLSENNCILVNPSYQEGMPTTVIEALATGTLVIASNVGGTSEISEKEDLILFEAGNKIDLEGKMKLGIKDYDKLNGLSLDLINEKFNRDKNINNLFDLVK